MISSDEPIVFVQAAFFTSTVLPTAGSLWSAPANAIVGPGDVVDLLLEFPVLAEPSLHDLDTVKVGADRKAGDRSTNPTPAWEQAQPIITTRAHHTGMTVRNGFPFEL